MTDQQDTTQAIRARILDLLESGAMPKGELAAAVAVNPDERQQVADWNQTVTRVAQQMLDDGEIALDSDGEPVTYQLPSSD